MRRQKTSTKLVPGYRAPRTAEEQSFWDSYTPDFRAWSQKKRLTIDEAAALAMGFDPTGIESISFEKKQPLARFNTTRRWFKQHEKHFPGGIDLLGISVIGMDYHLSLPPALSVAALYASEGFFDSDKHVARLERQVAKLKKQIEGLNAKVAAGLGHKPKKQRPSDVKNRETTSSRIIVALMATIIRDKDELKDQFVRIKTGGRSRVVSKVKSALHELNWNVDEASILQRFRGALEEWEPD
jgi:hypothetical protein